MHENEPNGDGDANNDGTDYIHSIIFDAGTTSSGPVYAGLSGGTDERGLYGIDSNNDTHSYIIDGSELRLTEVPNGDNPGEISVITYLGDADFNGKEFHIKSYTIDGVFQEEYNDVVYPTQQDAEDALANLP